MIALDYQASVAQTESAPEWGAPESKIVSIELAPAAIVNGVTRGRTFLDVCVIGDLISADFFGDYKVMAGVGMVPLEEVYLHTYQTTGRTYLMIGAARFFIPDSSVPAILALGVKRGAPWERAP